MLLLFKCQIWLLFVLCFIISVMLACRLLNEGGVHAVTLLFASISVVIFDIDGYRIQFNSIQYVDVVVIVLLYSLYI